KMLDVIKFPDCVVIVFFFQAEDGIRDFHVTGVQTCALPISPAPAAARLLTQAAKTPQAQTACRPIPPESCWKISMNEARLKRLAEAAGLSINWIDADGRSEERRAGRESRSQSST